MQRNQIKTIRKKQRIQGRSRNSNSNGGLEKDAKTYNFDIHKETLKDRQANMFISQNNKHVQFLTNDVEDLDDRILALDVKINSFLKDDYEIFTKEAQEISDKLEEQEQFKKILVDQLETLNEQFKMDIIGKFSDKESVEKLKKIIYDSIG